MKSKILLNLIFFTTIFFFSGQAQDTLDVAPFTVNGDLNLVPAIIGDTLESGERANLDRVYRLERGGVYFMDQTIFADYSIRLVADGDDSMRPPMLVRGKYPSGDPIKTFFTFTGNDLSHSFENILFTGVDEDREYLSQWNKGLKIAGDNIKLSLSKCIMNAWSGLFLEIAGDNASLFVRDSKWRNGVGAQAPPWGAQQTVAFTTHLDTVIYTNNTFFNTGGFWLFQEDGIADYVKVEHNTLFTSMIDLVRMRDFVNTDFRSNLFYGTHAYGQTQSERDASWFDKDGERISMFSIDTSGIDLLSTKGLVESDKRILVSHNTYYSPQVLQDWWATIPGIFTPVWMHDRTMGMFDDDAAYPLLDAYDNFEMDPQFEDTAMETWVVDEVVEYCDKVRDGLAVTTRNYDEHTGNADVLLIAWPLPESLVYTNAAMLVGGHDGLPVGDLNWYPDERELYSEIPVSTNNLVENKTNIIERLRPNPAVEQIAFELNFPNQTVATIEIFDMNGRIAKTVSPKSYVAGNNRVELNIENLAVGVYIIQVSTPKYFSTKRFIKQE